MYETDVLIIGSGVIGLAIAREVSLRGHSALVVDENASPGMGTSSRNSEVIHAGIYYPKCSLKAWHCVRGRQLLYKYCQDRDIPHSRIGKLIVATSEQENTVLAQIHIDARNNGLQGEDELQFLTRQDVEKMEPEVFCTAALLSPSTGIIDSHSYMTHLMADAEAAGAVFSFGTKINHLEPGPPHLLSGESQGERFEIAARHLFIAGGLHTATLTRAAGIPTPQDYWLKGNYFALNARSPFKRLIYPVPVVGGLGVHATLDLAGNARFGPDTQPITTETYDVDPARAEAFELAIRRYWPGMPGGVLIPGYSGIRPKLKPSGGAFADFVIDGPASLGIDDLVAMQGIESPGLTSSLSLAEAACNTMFGEPA